MSRFSYFSLLALIQKIISIGALLAFPAVVHSQNPEWIVYNTENSELPGNKIIDITFDEQENIVVRTYAGDLATFDGEKWTVFDLDNSGLSDTKVPAVCIDDHGVMWIGTGGGLERFDGEDWKRYHIKNSGLPDNWIWSLAIDSRGNKWIGTESGGLAVYREGGVILSVTGDHTFDENSAVETPTTFSFSQNFPNPFNPQTTVEFTVSKEETVHLTIFNIMGQKVRTIISHRLSPGTHSICWNGRDNSGQEVSSGTYIAALMVGSTIATKRMLLVR
jgi:hypothetical protein